MGRQRKGPVDVVEDRRARPLASSSEDPGAGQAALRTTVEPGAVERRARLRGGLCRQQERTQVLQLRGRCLERLPVIVDEAGRLGGEATGPRSLQPGGQGGQLPRRIETAAEADCVVQ